MTEPEIPSFEDAVEAFRRFLTQQGHMDPLTWVFRDDICFFGPSLLFVRTPVPNGGDVLAARVFEQGRRRGLVELHAVARGADTVFATAWYPRTAEDEVQGWSVGMKLSAAEPLRKARRVPSFLWPIVQRTRGYRRSQQHEPWIGTRVWAAQ